MKIILAGCGKVGSTLVKELTAEKPIARTFGEDLQDGIQSSLDWLGQVGR